VTTKYGQSDAVALELVAALNDASPSFCLPVAAERKFARVREIAAVSKIGESVAVHVFPGAEQSEVSGISGVYDDTYAVHVLLQQNVTDTTSGGLSESQLALLMKLRAEIIEYVCARRMSCPDAVHPFSGAIVAKVAHGPEGVYDLARIESMNEFYSDVIFTYRAVGLRRRNG